MDIPFGPVSDYVDPVFAFLNNDVLVDSNGEQLTFHEYSISTGEDVSMFAIDVGLILST